MTLISRQHPPMKQFKIVSYQGKKPRYCLSNQKNEAVDRRPEQGIDLVADYLPEEKIAAAWKEHMSNIKQLVLESILKNSPDFFEHLVVELLLKMGYGNDKNSGIVTGRPHDGGIDGIISEDKLGFDLYPGKTTFVKLQNRPEGFTSFCRCNGTCEKGSVYHNILLYKRSREIYK